jgi:hypothetical protein
LNGAGTVLDVEPLVTRDASGSTHVISGPVCDFRRPMVVGRRRGPAPLA